MGQKQRVFHGHHCHNSQHPFGDKKHPQIHAEALEMLRWAELSLGLGVWEKISPKRSPRVAAAPKAIRDLLGLVLAPRTQLREQEPLGKKPRISLILFPASSVPAMGRAGEWLASLPCNFPLGWARGGGLSG